ncbi:MAG: hypothetical protein Q9160_006372 [Pyrenula sp. 1 TL-2023]
MPSWSRSLSLLSLSLFSSLVTPLPQSSITRRATNHCGNSDSQIIQSTPWIVFNMLYNSKDLTSSDSWCTIFDSVTTTASGAQAIKWGSTSTISPAKDTVKGYSFVGLTQGLEATLDSIGSVPADYSWTRSNTTAFKGNIVFDFMTNDRKGDSTSTDSHELMLWLEYEGGQTPIGFTRTPQKIDNLFGTSWSLYSGKNTDTGITVTSMLADTQFDGAFTGDLMDWFRALANTGLFSMSTFLNVGNAGNHPLTIQPLPTRTEIFFGDSTMSATLALEISDQAPASSAVASPSPSASATAAVSSVAATADAESTAVTDASSVNVPALSTAATVAATTTDAVAGTSVSATEASPSVPAASETATSAPDQGSTGGDDDNDDDETCDAE